MNTDAIAESYGRLKSLKRVGDELGIPWQTVYVRLRKAGVPVTGDKLRYGSEKDKLAAIGERLFLSLVPFASNDNDSRFQPKIDFHVLGHGVDVKTSRKRRGSLHGKPDTLRWAWSVKKQEVVADFFVCFGLDEHDDIGICLLVPGDVVRKYTTLTLSANGTGKWADYTIPPSSLAPFFIDLGEKELSHTHTPGAAA